ncbi:unnamed protein product, partial [Mesorhabditis spiculigera]
MKRHLIAFTLLLFVSGVDLLSSEGGGGLIPNVALRSLTHRNSAGIERKLRQEPASGRNEIGVTDVPASEEEYSFGLAMMVLYIHSAIVGGFLLMMCAAVFIFRCDRGNPGDSAPGDMPTEGSGGGAGSGEKKPSNDDENSAASTAVSSSSPA